MPTYNSPVNFYSETKRFMDNVTSLQLTSELAVGGFSDTKVKAETTLERLKSEGVVDIWQEGDEQRFILLDADRSLDFEAAKRQLKAIKRASILIRRSFLVSLISQWDDFIASIVKVLFANKIEIFSGAKKEISIDELRQYSSIKDFEEKFIYKEIDKLMRQSHDEQLDYLKAKTLDFYGDRSAWKPFFEMVERRNLFVHTDGKVTEQYLEKCEEEKIFLPRDVVLETQFENTPDYFNSSCSILIELGIKLAFSIWRKLFPEEIEEVNGQINNILIHLIAYEDFYIAQNIANFALDYKSKALESNILAIKMNLAQAYKWSGQNQKCIDVLLKIDWTTKSDLFLLTKYTLEDDFSRAADMMMRVGLDPYCDRSAYINWPIFTEFRKSEEFRNAFRKIFSDDPPNNSTKT
jgi:hypothetical protein